MNIVANRSRKALALIVAATVLAGTFTASSSASAKPFFFPKPIHFNHGPHFGGFGLGAAIVGGLVVGALVAHAEHAERECYLTNRRTFDDYGNEYIRQIRVCD
jgi:hypothetical protein